MGDVIDQDTFIFTLKNQHNIPPTKFTKNSSRTSDRSIYNYPTYGPIFGKGYDLWFCNKSDLRGGVKCKFPSTFSDTTGKGSSLFSRDSSGEFYGYYLATASEVEVYRVVGEAKDVW
eukprot:TRINITY_DN6043_c0_g2_i1.p1 TRINITY_DN6043_c0_g2~~TRINITY_DN6043_c0_g2_i1.p1  ORF type:complete len:124 (-),score=26.71 TRINITY_DN6043_c0_g2_i1:1-351(-)